eukprot:gnl/TRDRNA2_/TRDRNA2_30594_c0_seq1.p1 gnl/TRDRNA2_/TRDRNA2_30594_c0~~gnl/TRDRNA2_/TRDRNA2_30594_c0_seq1.p1  ORF type:complete len:419 (-),score=96.12 gnl/TRDRNA2_/TRDRNA2_30594_c0_seq1:33-1247(-)
MGKNNKNKQSSATEPVAATAAQPVAATVAADWFSSLSEAEQALELKRREQREAKAQAEKKKADDDRWWREQNEKKQAKVQRESQRQEKKQDNWWHEVMKSAQKDGVLVAEEHGDQWYVDLGGGLWKEVNDSYFCRHCQVTLNDSNLAAHLGGEKHRKKMGYTKDWAPDAAPRQCAPCAPSMGSTAQASWALSNGTLECWQEQDPQGYVKCKACNKVCDGVHESTDEHARKLENWLAWNKAGQGEERTYEEPAQQWLAYVACEDFGPHRYLKCLFCNKWIQDWDGYNTVGYAGAHGDPSSANQKDHKKKMNDLDWYLGPEGRSTMEPILAEKRKWHPPKGSVPPTSNDDPPLPAGWNRTWSAEQQMYYYWCLGGTPQWEKPTQPAAAPPPVAATTPATFSEEVEC